MGAAAALNIRPCCVPNPALKYLRRPAVLFYVLAMFIMLAPLLLPLFGIGTEFAIMTNDSIICSSTAKTGLIGNIISAISLIPFIGSEITQSPVLAVIISVTFLLTANLLRPNLYFIGISFYIAGVFFSLPAILPAISHGSKFLAMLLGYEYTAQLIADFIGKPQKPMAVYSFISSGGAIIATHLGCIASGVVIIFSLLFRQFIRTALK